MKIKKEDAGLYLAFALIGGGLGLMCGALVATYLEKKKLMIESELEPADDSWSIEKRREIEYTIEQKEADRQELEELKRREGYDFKHPVAGQQDKWSIRNPNPDDEEKPERKRNKKRENNSGLTDEELAAFIVEWSPNVWQIEMLRNGTMTPEQVASVREAEMAAMDTDPEDYGQQYRSYYSASLEEAEELEREDAEELKDRVNALGVIEDRWSVTAYMPENPEGWTVKEIQWDDKDNEFYLLRNGHPMHYNIESTVGHGVWEHIASYMATSKLWDVYITDLQNPRIYHFHKLAELGEDDPSLDDPHHPYAS